MKVFGISLWKGRKSAERQSAEWFARLRSGDVSAEEFQEYLDWAERYPDRAEDVEVLEQLWARMADMPVTPPASLKTPPRRRAHFEKAALAAHSVAFRPFRFGAVAVLAIIVAVGALQGLSGYAERGDVYETGRAESTVVNLADGSTAHLNVFSRIRVRYLDGERRIELAKGEAFFTVTPDKTRPFIVEVGDSRVRALGTSFNVKLVPEKEVAVTLVEGRIQVSRLWEGAPAESETLNEPGQQVSVRLSPIALSASQTNIRRDVAPTIDVSTTAIDETVAWRRGKLIFDGDTLERAIAEINRHSNHTIRLTDDDIAQMPVYGIFNAGDWQGIVSAIERSYPLRAKQIRLDLTVLEPVAREG